MFTPGSNLSVQKGQGKVILSDNAQEAVISGPTSRKLTPEAIDTNITSWGLFGIGSATVVLSSSTLPFWSFAPSTCALGDVSDAAVSS